MTGEFGQASGAESATPDSQLSSDDNSPPERPSCAFPTVDATLTRSAVAWWFVFTAPVAIVLALIVVAVVADRDSVVWAFTLGVWAFALTLGIAATPRSGSLWWVTPLVVAFAASALALGLVIVLGTATNTAG